MLLQKVWNWLSPINNGRQLSTILIIFNVSSLIRGIFWTQREIPLATHENLPSWSYKVDVRLLCLKLWSLIVTLVLTITLFTSFNLQMQACPSSCNMSFYNYFHISIGNWFRFHVKDVLKEGKVTCKIQFSTKSLLGLKVSPILEDWLQRTISKERV